jgi:folate-binding protein YgfZ
MELIHLKHRTIIDVSGIDAIAFLQGLTTNNLTQLEPGGCVYTVFLNAQGKFLNDAFAIMLAPDHIWLDVETEHSRTLLKKLNIYRLRSKVMLEQRPDYLIYACFDRKKPADDWLMVYDPRSTRMGQRIYTTTEQSASGIDLYDEHRIPLGIPDGTRDIPFERGFIMEYGLDRLNAIDFKKGCYVGQELTARMYYRKLGKRQLVYVTFDEAAPPPGTEVLQAEESVGIVRSVVKNMALVHMKIEALSNTAAFTADGKIMKLHTRVK